MLIKSENCFLFIVVMYSSKQDIVFAYISLLHPAHNDFIGFIPSSILAFLHFILVSIAEIIFHFNGSHEQFHIGHYVRNVSLLHTAYKDFTGLIPSSISALLHFILKSITEMIFHFHGSHEIFHIGCCVWSVSLLHLGRKDFIGIIPSSLPVSLHFILESIAEIIFYFHVIHEQFHIGCFIWIASLLHPARKVLICIIPSPTLAFLDFILVFIFYFHGSHEQFDIGYTIIKCVLCFQYLTSQDLIVFTHSKKYAIKLSHC